MSKYTRVGQKQIVEEKNGDGGSKTLSEAEQSAIREADARVATLKLALADISIQEAMLSSRKADVLKAYEEASKAMLERVKATARANGIDPDAPPEKGRWNFDVGTMTFSRVE